MVDGWGLPELFLEAGCLWGSGYGMKRGGCF